MKSLHRMPRINNSTNNRIARTTGIRQQRRYSFCYSCRTGRFPRPVIDYRNVPVPVLIVLAHKQINLREMKNGNIPRTLMPKTSLYEKHLHTSPPPKKKRIRTSKKRITAKDADAEFRLKVNSAIETCFNGCLAISSTLDNALQG